jgi:molybdenum cofactor cytidylyltransferase
MGAGLDDVLVVTGDEPLDDLVTGGGAVAVHNRHWATGQGSSLQAALDFIAQSPAYPATDHPGSVSAIVIGLGDQPMVTTEAWRGVSGCTQSPIVVATYKGKRRQPVRLHRDVWPLLDLSGDEGAKSLIALRPDLVTELPCDGNPVDIDTVEDLARWNL